MEKKTPGIDDPISDWQPTFEKLWDRKGEPRATRKVFWKKNVDSTGLEKGHEKAQRGRAEIERASGGMIRVLPRRSLCETNQIKILKKGGVRWGSFAFGQLRAWTTKKAILFPERDNGAKSSG